MNLKKACFVVTKDYQQNRMFDLKNPILNRDNCLLPFVLLREKFRELGYDLHTQDINTPETSDIVIYNEMPKPFDQTINKEKSYLILFESELVRQDNWDKEKHNSFKKIFTWNDNYVDGVKYVKFNFPNTIKKTEPSLAGRNTLAALISGNKTSSHLKELYSERVKTINWFEKNHPLDFHYYGVGWDYKLPLHWQRVFKKLNLMSLVPKNHSVCFKGKVKSKHEALKQYKFAICYENAKQINGYITEKIFDCLFAGCVPVYWGPDNITNYIPANCFIDRTQFKTHEEMYQFLNNMSDEKYLEYQKAIFEFLSGPGILQFGDDFFVSNIIRNVFDE